MATSKAEYKTKAEHAYQKGVKYTKTTLTRWKPDWEKAANEFAEAVKNFRLAGLQESQEYLDALVQSADAYERSDSYHLAAKNMETAAQLIEKLGDEKQQAEYLIKSAHLHQMNQNADKAIAGLVKAAIIVGNTDIDEAMTLFNEAADIVDLEQRGKFAQDQYKSFVAFLLRKERVKEAIQIINRLNTIYKKDIQLFDKYLYKNVVSLVVLHLYLNEYELAAEELANGGMFGQFHTSNESEAAQSLVLAINAGDEKAFKAALTNPVFIYLDNEVARIAKKLTLNAEQAQKAAQEQATQAKITANQQVDIT